MFHYHGLLQLPLLLLLSTLNQSVNADAYSPPLLDSASVGQLGIVGQFAGLSPYTNTLQSSTPSPGIGIYEQDASSIFSSHITGSGTLYASCMMDQQLYLGGLFSSLFTNNKDNTTTKTTTTVNNIARWDMSTKTLSPLEQGVDGPVYALYCDSTNHTVYVGGEFHQPVGMNSTLFAGSVAQWYNNQWLPLPWQGFNGPVHVITPNLKKETLLFGGRFDATGDGVYFNANSSQPVNLDQPTAISSGNGALSGNNSQPNSVICPNSTPENLGQPWLLQEDVPGYWQATFAYPIQPSMFRISNTQLPDQATRSFSILALGSNELFQLAYVDPTTQVRTTCSDMCFMANSPNVTFQDFTVENAINTTGVRIEIHSWYGAGGGLGNVQIYQADNTLNPHLSGGTNNNCTGSGTASTSAVGEWKETFAYGSYENFLTTSIPLSELATTNTSLTYAPYIPSQGRYTIYANTPGCVGTSTCNQRTQVELTIQMTPNNSTTMIIDQTNTQDMSTTIYDGLVTASSDSFHPTVTLRPAPNAVPPASGNVTIVAESLSLVRNGTNATLISILEFSPQNYSTQQTISWKPLADQLTPGSTVLALDASNGDSLYIGGQFVGTTSPYRNVAVYDYTSSKLSALHGNGLDGNVTSLLLSGTDLFVGGLFNNTMDRQLTGLNHAAVYHTADLTWSTLAQGTNGNINDVIPSLDNTTITFSGNFSHVLQPDGKSKSTPGNSIWNPQQQIWTDRQAFISGNIESWRSIDSTASSSNTSNSMLIGNIQAAQTFYSVGAATFPSVASPQWTRYYGLFDNDDTAIVNAGLFWHNSTSKQQVTILGGRFTMQNGGIANLAMYHDGTWSGFQLGNAVGSPSLVNALLQVHDVLYIGGQFSGQIQQQSVKSMAIYSLTDRVALPVSGITDESGAPGLVNVIEPSSDGSKIYIGGNFAKAGSLDCVSVCEWDANMRQWNPVGQGLNGTVESLSINNNKLTVIGSLTNQQQPTKFAQIDPSSTSTWSSSPSSSSSSDPDIQKLTLTAVVGAPDDGVIVAGQNSEQPPQTVVGLIDSQQKFTPLPSTLSSSLTSSYLLPGSVIQQLLFVPTADTSADQPRYPPNTNTLLMAVGHMQLSKSGNVSVALYDGKAWSPYVLASQFNGQPGHANAVFHELDCCKANNIRHYLPVPAVILISIAISLGLLFVLVGMGLVWMYMKRRRQGVDYPEPMPPWQPSSAAGQGAGGMGEMMGSSHDGTSPSWRPASSIAAILDAAQLATLGGAAGLAIASSSQQQQQQQQPKEHNVDDLGVGYDGGGSGVTSSSPASVSFDQLKAMALLQPNYSGPATEERPQLYAAKYPFDAKEFGELGFDADESIVVTDTSDNVWWMGYKDDGTGKPISGLFPSNYVSRPSTGNN